jgi:hypothetical protein
MIMMEYLELYARLKRFYTFEAGEFTDEVLEIKLTNLHFKSDTHRAFPEGDEYTEINPLVKALMKFYLSHNEYSDRYLLKMLSVPDIEIQENNEFTYSILSDLNCKEADSAIILLHGLNERGWEKYLPWAYHLMKSTGKPVILFPNAFHMNRAPLCWSNFRLMNEISAERKNLLPGVTLSSPINSAISTRLQFVPQRFVYSGLQTIYDITKLADQAKDGLIPGLNEGTSINLFGYSIGAFIAEIIMMSNPYGLFNNSRCVLFCGGSTLDKMLPINKYILDSGATEAIMDFYVNRLEQNLSNDERLSALFGSEDEETFIFKAMLSDKANSSVRSRYLSKIRERLYCIALGQDDVMRSEAIKETLDIPQVKKIKIETLDFDYKYTHENPFPSLTKIKNEVQNGFEEVFGKAAMFLN